MGDHDDGASKGGEGFLEHAEGGEIEVVGWFVEDDEVAAGLEDFGEHEAGAFAPGEEVDPFVDAVVGEEKALEIGSGTDGLFPEEDLLVAVGDFIEEGAGSVELHPSLIDVVDLHLLAQLGGALCRL